MSFQIDGKSKNKLSDNSTNFEYNGNNSKYKVYGDKILLWQKGDYIYPRNTGSTTTIPNSIILYKALPNPLQIPSDDKRISSKSGDTNSVLNTISNIDFEFWLENDSGSSVLYKNSLITTFQGGNPPPPPTNVNISLATTTHDQGLFKELVRLL